jgi:hypothetical protein
MAQGRSKCLTNGMLFLLEYEAASSTCPSGAGAATKCNMNSGLHLTQLLGLGPDQQVGAIRQLRRSPRSLVFDPCLTGDLIWLKLMLNGWRS